MSAHGLWPALAALAVLAAVLTACGGPSPDAPRGYVFRVLPGTTFDLAQGRALDPQAQAERLRTVRLLFLGEHHTDAASHQAQLDVLRLLQARGQTLTVALEMFPLAADPALEEWRQGKLDEPQFLERSHWYETWGFPWHHYRGLFHWFREQHIPLHGVNADEATRTAVRLGKLAELPAAVREEAGDLDTVLEPHRDLLLETLRAGGHGGELEPESPQFKAFLRVQTLWDRLMGERTARLAEAQRPQGTVVLLIGSGHLAYKLGANLHAARASALPQLSIWNSPVAARDLDGNGRARVPVGIADWAYVYLPDPAAPEYPTFRGVGLAEHARGVRVESVSAFAPPWLRALRAGDVIGTLNGAPMRSPTHLRLAAESLPWDQPAQLTVEREGVATPLTLRPAHDPS